MNQTSPVVRACQTNLDRFSLPLAEWRSSGWSAECVECLAQCGDCEAGPFVELNGFYIFTDSLGELSAKLATALSSPPSSPPSR